MKEISFKIKDVSNRITVFNHLCNYHAVNPDTVYARQSLDGVSVNITMLLSDAQKMVDDPQCPDWLIDQIDEASFKAA